MSIRLPQRQQLKKLAKSRLVAALALAVFCLAAASAVTVSAKTVRILDGEKAQTVMTLSTEPEEILKQADVSLKDGDQVGFTGFKDGYAELEITRAVVVKVSLGGVSQTVKLCTGTVKDAVELAGIELSENDYMNVDPNAAVSDGMEIAVNSVDYAYVTQKKVLDYETKTVYSSSLAKGKVKETAGTKGLEIYTYRQKVVNGQVTSSELVSVETVKEPVNAQKIIGTKVAASAKTSASLLTSLDLKTVSTLQPSTPLQVDKIGRPLSYKKLITGKATAYSPKDGNTTATGKRAQVGYIAVNPDIIPYGTKMFIRSTDGRYIYGYAVAEDTGGFTKKGKVLVDLFFGSYSEAIAFGVRNVEIYILG